MTAPGLQVFRPYFCFDCCCLPHRGLLLTLVTARLSTSPNCLYPSAIHLHWKAPLSDYTTLSVFYGFSCFFSEIEGVSSVFFVLRFDGGCCLLGDCDWFPPRGHLREALKIRRTLCFGDPVSVSSIMYVHWLHELGRSCNYFESCFPYMQMRNFFYRESNTYESILLHELGYGMPLIGRWGQLLTDKNKRACVLHWSAHQRFIRGHPAVESSFLLLFSARAFETVQGGQVSHHCLLN